MIPDYVQRVLSCFAGVKEVTPGPGMMRQWKAGCPAHDDRNPSLSIGLTHDGKIVIYDFAGCTLAAILRATGLTEADLFPPREEWRDRSPRRGRSPRRTRHVTKKPAPGTNHRETEMTQNCQHNDQSEAADQGYDTPEAAIADLIKRWGEPKARWGYYSDKGKPVGYVYRWDTPKGKEIRPVSLYPEGWKRAAMPIPRPLYRLPEVLRAEDQTIIVTEGEKAAAEAACRLGLVATTSSGGAKAAKQTDWTPLRGRQVIILPDHDEAGEQYAAEVAALCHKAGTASIKILRLADYAPSLPPGGDLADVLASPDRCGLPLGDVVKYEALREWLLRTAESLPPWQPPQTTGSIPGSSDNRVTQLTNDDWPDPQPLVRQAELPDWPAGTLPPEIENFLQVLADRLEVPLIGPAMAAMAMLSGLAANLGIIIAPDADDPWRTEPPNLWVALIGEPGVRKTPIIRRVAGPFWKLERQMQKRWERKQAVSTAAPAAAETEAVPTDIAETLEPLSQGKEKPLPAAGPQKDEDELPRLIAGDITAEKLAMLLQNNRALIVKVDELADLLKGWRKDYQAQSRPFFLSAYDGLPHRIDRVSRPSIRLERPLIALLGGIQPKVWEALVLQPSLEAGGESADGLLQRITPLIIRLRDYNRHPPQMDWDTVRNYKLAVFHTWRTWRRREWKDRRLILSAQAALEWHAFRERNAGPLRDLSLSEAWRSLLAKREGLLARIAGTLAFAWREREVSSRSMANAVRLVEVLDAHARCGWGLTEGAGEGVVFRAVRLTTALLERGMAEFTARDLYTKHVAGLYHSAETRAVLEVLERAEWVRYDSRAKAYRLNPKLTCEFVQSQSPQLPGS